MRREGPAGRVELPSFDGIDADTLSDRLSCQAFLDAKQLLERSSQGALLRAEDCASRDDVFIAKRPVAPKPPAPRPKPVRCADEELKIGEECVKRCATPPADARTASLSLNSIPQSYVLLGDCALGQTPIFKATVTAGPQRVRFVHPERGIMLRTVEVRAGQHQVVAVKFER